MSETVCVLMNNIDTEVRESYQSILLMPDTFIRIKDEINTMKELLNTYEIVVLVWKIQEYQKGKVGQVKIEENKVTDVIDKNPTCMYEHFWGGIGWNSEINKYIDPKWETIGDLLKKAIEMNIEIGTVFCDEQYPYYDCGTYSEYFTMIKSET